MWGWTYSDSKAQLVGKTVTILIQVVNSNSDYYYIPTDAELGNTTSAIKNSAKTDAQALKHGYHVWIVNEAGQRILVSRFSPTSEYNNDGVLPTKENWTKFGDALAFIMEGVGASSVDYKVAIDNIAVWTGLGDMPKDKSTYDYESMLNPQTARIPTDSSESGVVLAKNDQAKIYAVLPSDTASDAYRNALYAKDKLEFFLKEKLGNSNLSIPHGTRSDYGYEILIGDTGRSESAALKATLSGNQYAIKRDGNKIIIVATNDAFLYDAVEYFINNYLSKGVDTTLTDSKAVYSGSINYKGTGNTSTVRYLMSTSGKIIGSTSSSIYTIDRPDSTYTRNQGGCAGGNGFYYQCFIPSSEGNSRIAKVDLATGRTTHSGVIADTNHTNDMTYNSKIDRLIIAHNSPRANTLSIINPYTLEKEREITIPCHIYSITNSPERDVYMIGCSNTRYVRILSADFTTLSNDIYPVDSWLDATVVYSGSTKGRFVTQGIGSDDTFIYCVLYDAYSGQKQNVITVFDWYGNFVGTININLGTSFIEPESIDVDENGRITGLF